MLGFGVFFTVTVSLSALLTLYGLYELVFGGYTTEFAIPSALPNVSSHGTESNESTTLPPKVIHNFYPIEDLLALVAVDQSETIMTAEEDGKDAVIFISNSALACVIGGG